MKKTGTYNRLINLYKHSNSLTPFEDFTTEIFAGILDYYPEILKSFVREILKIEKGDYQIYTQKTYALTEYHIRVDMVLENDETICFIENKVESAEMENQLERYGEVITKIESDKNKYLRYCTKYFDPKVVSYESIFKQFRWSDIAQLLYEHIEKPQIQDFYYFLKSHGMANTTEISAKQLFLMENLRETLNNLDELLDRIKPAFNSSFGSNSNPDNTSQMRNHGRYVFYMKDVFGEGGSSEIGVGFYLMEKPKAIVWIWTPGSNIKSDLANSKIEEFKEIFTYTEKYYSDFTIELEKFIIYDKQVEELEKWFIATFTKLTEFINKTPDLDWHTKKN